MLNAQRNHSLRVGGCTLFCVWATLSMASGCPFAETQKVASKFLLVPRTPNLLNQVQNTKTSIAMKNDLSQKKTISVCRAQRDGSNGIWVT